MSAASPKTLLWGDSFAMALAPGLASSSQGGIVQATKAVCGPTLGLAPVNGGLFNRGWGEDCIKFNETVLEYVKQHPELDVVVLSSALTQYVPGAEAGWSYLVRTPTGNELRSQDTDPLVSSFAATISEVRRLGKRVVLVAPPPGASFDIGRCLERLGQGKPTVSAHGDCTFSMEEYQKQRRAILDFLGQLRARNMMPIVDFDKELCGGGRCETRLNGTVLYRDGGHLSSAGSVALGNKMSWGSWFGGSAE
jgi:hypothetical protein